VENSTIRTDTTDQESSSSASDDTSFSQMADDEPKMRDKPNVNTPKYSFGLRSPRRSQTRKKLIVPRISSYTSIPLISQTLVKSQ
jgi:hypothetical protein